MSLSTKTTKFLVSTVVALGLAGAASATDKTFAETTDNLWSTAGNWTPSGKPVDGDKAIIPDGETCVVNANEAADSFEIQEGGFLIINAGNVLTIDQSSSVDELQGLQLAGSGSELKINATLTISGDGSIQGQNNGAKIQVVSSVTLTSTTTFEGTMELMGSGTFNNGNGGLVHANVADNLIVNTGALGAGHANAAWQSSNGSGKLVFKVGYTTGGGIAGTFDLDAGEMQFEAAMVASGKVDQDGGILNIDNNFTLGEYDWEAGTGSLAGGSSFLFQFTTFTSTSQTNPDNNGSANDPPYEVVGNAGLGDVTWP